MCVYFGSCIYYNTYLELYRKNIFSITEIQRGSYDGIWKLKNLQEEYGKLFQNKIGKFIRYGKT